MLDWRVGSWQLWRSRVRGPPSLKGRGITSQRPVGKTTRRSSRSKNMLGHPGQALSVHSLGQSEESFQSSLDRLVGTHRTAAIEQFSKLATEIEEDSALAFPTRISILLKAVFCISDSIDRLSRSAPEKAPELWVNRADKSENAYEFTRRVYVDYLERGLSKPDIFSLDPKLYQAILDRHRRHKDRSLQLRNKRQVTDALLAELGNTISPAEIVDSLPEIFRQRLKLYRAVTGRRHRQTKLKTT
jgi:hypothetical protein